MRSARSRLGPVAVAVSNLIPMIGVFALGWSTAAVLGVYVLELAAVLFWAVVRIPFAEKRPNNALGDGARLLGPLEDKRGPTALPGPFPPVYLRNAPTLVVAVVVLAPLELFAALAVFGLSDPTVTPAGARQLSLGGVGVFASRGVETCVDYFRDGGYREHSPRSVLLAPFKHLFGVGALLVVVAGLTGDVGDAAVVGLVLVGKLAYDLRTLQVERDPDRRGLFYRLYGGKETEIPADPVVEPDGDPVVRVRPARSVAVADAAYRGVAYTVTSLVVLCYAVAALLGVVAPSRLVAVPLGAVLAFAGLRATVRYLRYGTLEYRCYEGTLVAYDGLLEEPQARIDRSEVRDVAVETDLVDRAFGTATVTFERDDGGGPPARLTVPDPDEVERDDRSDSVSVVHVEDPAAVADALGVAWRVERDAERAEAVS